MVSWSYGFVEKVIEVSPTDRYEVLMLCEIYILKSGGKGYVPVDWKQIRKKDAKMIMDDLSAQIMAGKVVHFKERDFE